MPKNRDYTGLLRTPPSLAWLIRERARLKGQIDALDKRLEEIPRELVRLRGQLAALDAVIPRHEVEVDPSKIVGIRQHAPRLLPYGVMTKTVLKCLRTSDKPLTTSTIMAHLCSETGFELTKANRATVMNSLRYWLKELVNRGVLQRHHSATAGHNDEGRWSLSSDQGEEALAA